MELVFYIIFFISNSTLFSNQKTGSFYNEVWYRNKKFEHRIKLYYLIYSMLTDISWKVEECLCSLSFSGILQSHFIYISAPLDLSFGNLFFFFIFPSPVGCLSVTFKLYVSWNHVIYLSFH